MSGLIFKIVHAEEWRAAEAACVYGGSAKDTADGFLHFSTEEQLIGTLTRYYAGADDLVLVAVVADALGDLLKFEPATAGALYPHFVRRPADISCEMVSSNYTERGRRVPAAPMIV